jgi:uncharacterized phage protein gp47/JayE
VDILSKWRYPLDMNGYVDSTGYTAPRAADFRTLIRADVEASWGVAIDWNSDTLLSGLVDAIATRLGTLGEASQAVYDAMQIANATGQQLTNLCQLVGIPRLGATYSQVTMTLTGTAGAIIPGGLIVQGGGTDGRARWVLASTVTLDGAGSGSGVAVAEGAGAVSADSGTITLIATPTAGLLSVTNADPATVGDNEETDAELRRRRQASLQQQGAHSLNAIRASLLGLSGISAAACIDNPSAATTTVQGLSLTAWSVAAVVLPSTLTDAQITGLAKSLYSQVAAGLQLSGDQTATVTGADGYARTVRWFYGSEVGVDVDVVLNLKSGYELADVQAEVEAAIAGYFDGLTLGDAARRLALLTLIGGIEGIVGCFLQLDGGIVDVTALLSERLIAGVVSIS